MIKCILRSKNMLKMQGQMTSKMFFTHLHMVQENCICVCMCDILQSCPSHGTSWPHLTLSGIADTSWMLSTIKRCMTRSRHQLTPHILAGMIFLFGEKLRQHSVDHRLTTRPQTTAQQTDYRQSLNTPWLQLTLADSLQYYPLDVAAVVIMLTIEISFTTEYLIIVIIMITGIIFVLMAVFQADLT